MDASFWLLQFLNAMQYSMLLFLLSIGLTVIFGLMHFVNLAHASLYMLGAYFGISISALTGQFWLAFMLSPIIVTVIGAILYFTLIDRMRAAGPMNQVLVTFGLIFIILDLVRLGWGDIALGLEAPSNLSHTVSFWGISYPAYRLFIIALGLSIIVIMWLILARTQIGAMIRASVETQKWPPHWGFMLRLFFVVFCLVVRCRPCCRRCPYFFRNHNHGHHHSYPDPDCCGDWRTGQSGRAIAGSLIIGF